MDNLQRILTEAYEQMIAQEEAELGNVDDYLDYRDWKQGKMSPEQKAEYEAKGGPAAYEKAQAEREASTKASWDAKQKEYDAIQAGKDEATRKNEENGKKFYDHLATYYSDVYAKMAKEMEQAAIYGYRINEPPYPELTGDVTQDKAVVRDYLKKWFEVAQSQRSNGLGT